MSKRSRVAGFGSAAGLVLLGVLAAVSISGTAGQLAAFVLIALGLVLATSLAFLEVGLSEDRDRARENQAAGDQDGGAARQRPKQPKQSKRPSARPRPPSLDRSRGHRRRLR